MFGFIKNRVYIIDISILMNDISNCINIINENVMFMKKIDFKTMHMLTKYLLINTICMQIRDTNDVEVSPLIMNDLYNDLLSSNEIKIAIDILNNNFYGIYSSKLFNFSNVEVNVDVVLQGTSLYIYTYESEIN